MKTKDERIARKRSDMPKLYRGIYDRAMSGNSRKAAIRAMCLECMAWVRKEIDLCTSVSCPLYPYRPIFSDGDSDNSNVDGAESTNDTDDDDCAGTQDD